MDPDDFNDGDVHWITRLRERLGAEDWPVSVAMLAASVVVGWLAWTGQL
jgi:hypothetical protein